MYQGRTIQEVAAEVQRVAASARDFVVPTRALAMVQEQPVDDGKVTGEELTQALLDKPVGSSKGQYRLRFKPNGETLDLGIKDLAHGQMASRLGIPKKYYDRMKENAADLLLQNVNHWFNAQDDKRLIRTVDGQARAFLSDRYRPMDNLDLMKAILPVLTLHGMEIKSCQVTDTHLYIKAFHPTMFADIAEGDRVQCGVMIRNSEVGASSLAIQPMVFRLICTNGLISDRSMRKYHTGKAQGGNGSDQGWEYFTDDTRKKSDEALWGQVKDLTTAAIDGRIFNEEVDRLRKAKDKTIESTPREVVEVTREKFGLTEGQGDQIFAHLLQGGDMTQYGLLNAVTRASQDAEDYETATSMEAIGGKILGLTKAEWDKLSKN